MAAVLEQSMGNGSTANVADITVTHNSTSTTNNLIVCAASRRSFSDNNELSAEDQNGDSYTVSGSVADTWADNSVSGCLVDIFHKVSEGDETSTLVDLDSVSGDSFEEVSAVVCEYSGLVTTSVLNDSSGASSTNNTHTSLDIGDVTTTVADCLLFAALGQAAQDGEQTGFAWSDSFTTVVNQLTYADPFSSLDTQIWTAFRVVSSTGTYGTTPSWDDSCAAAGVICAFEIAAGGGGAQDTALPEMLQSQLFI